MFVNNDPEIWRENIADLEAIIKEDKTAGHS